LNQSQLQPGGLLRGDPFSLRFLEEPRILASTPRSRGPEVVVALLDRRLLRHLQVFAKGERGLFLLRCDWMFTSKAEYRCSTLEKDLITMPSDRIYIAPMQTLLDQVDDASRLINLYQTSTRG